MNEASLYYLAQQHADLIWIGFAWIVGAIVTAHLINENNQ
jgi:hypothetical protein